MTDPHPASTAETLFRSLADPTRRAIFERLCRHGEATVSELRAAAGISQPGVSKHLAVLKEAGLVADRPDGRRTHYRPCPGALLPLLDWTKEMTAFWDARLDALESLLGRWTIDRACGRYPHSDAGARPAASARARLARADAA